MYLQLAEESQIDNREFYIPCLNHKTGEITHVREDLLDNLPDEVYNRVMQEAEYLEANGMAEGLADKAARQARRAERKAAKTEKKQAKNAIKFAKANKIAGEQGATQESATAPGAEPKETVFGSILGTVKSIFGGKGDQAAAAAGATAPAKDNTIWYVLGGVAVLGLGVLVYSENKKSKRRRR